jgi:hypothetical protein
MPSTTDAVAKCWASFPALRNRTDFLSNYECSTTLGREAARWPGIPSRD